MATTIKVSAPTRDRVNAIGARTKQTAEQVVANALREYERSLFWREYTEAADAVTADPSAAAGERTEQELWDRPTPDGVNVAYEP